MQKINKSLLLLYAFTGLGFLLIYTLAEFFAYPGTIIPRSINSILLVVYLTSLNYLLIEHALPRLYPSRKKMVSGLLITLLLICLFSVGLYAWRQAWIELQVYTSYTNETSWLKGVLIHSPFSIASIIFFAISRHVYQYVQLKQDARQLRIEKQEAELNFLKSQIHPHFLFNTLNNIYSLSRDKSDAAPDAILRLSKILRFMLYETGGESIPVAEELKVIQDYIALESLRYDESLKISFRQQIDNLQQAIPPLLLLPLIENAFKHGVSETTEQPFVDIQFTLTEQRLYFIVSNSADPALDNQVIRENIGLSNLRRQLALLYTDYNLAVYQGKSVFTAELTIKLSSHV